MASLHIIDRGDDPHFRIILDVGERAVLQGLPERLETLLLHPDRSPKVIDRLFPPAHHDPDREREHRELIGSTLFEERRESLKAFAATLAIPPDGPLVTLDVDLATINLWLHVVNDFRLLLATELGIEDNDYHERPPEDPDAYESFVLLEHLSSLQYMLLEAVSG
ncbi:MAG: hypothetical protein CMJ83_08860 [Planctomycetes bacterium]|nr:hypothetical protein [Planctomycetota bacterium]